MTAQIAVSSLYGVAIASDTLMTLSRNGKHKVIPNSSKIIELGGEHRVLILNSGNAQLNDIPHDVHISEWARSLNGPLPTLAEYVRSYKAWAASEKRMISPESRRNLLTEFVERELRYLDGRLYEDRAVVFNLLETVASNKKIDASDRQTISRFREVIDNYENLPESSLTVLRRELTELDINLEGYVDNFFHKREPITEPRLAPANMKALVEVLEMSLTKKIPRTGLDSELGFAGMGQSESFVTVARMTCSGVYMNGLQVCKEEHSAIDPKENRGTIQYFAQFDSMRSMVSGFHPRIKGIVEDDIVGFLTQDFGVDADQAIQYANGVGQSMENAGQEIFVDPLFSTVGAFSITELAAFADSMVGIQANSAMFQEDQSTVGGLIEVATIDAKNGVVWHRRLPLTRLSDFGS